MNANAPTVLMPGRIQGGSRPAATAAAAPPLERPPLPNSDPQRPGVQPAKPPAFALRLLPDTIQEVAFANYFLSRFESELHSLGPTDLPPAAPNPQPLTPAQRAVRLLDQLDRIEHRVHEDLGRLHAALQGLVVTGLATLEENILSARQVLAEEVITPNLSVLKLEQDGGVKSPFLHLDPSGIIDAVLQDPTQDPATMHQAERTLRDCVAVQDLRDNVQCLHQRLAEPATRQTLESATTHLRQTAKSWGFDTLPPTLPGPWGLQLRLISLLNVELSRRAERLALLRPWVAAYDIRNSQLQDSLSSAFPFIPGDDAPPDPQGQLEALFSPSSPLGRLAETHGFLPVAQAFRERIARYLDRGEGLEPGTPERGLEEFPQAITRFLRQRIQATLRNDGALREHLTRGALALSNRGIAEMIAAVSVRLGYVEDPKQHRILMAAEAVENLRETLARMESGLRPPSADPESSQHRQPVVTLLESLMEQLRSGDALVDSMELETLVDDALDYLRRRSALAEFRAQRNEFIRRGWTARSRQRRMETPLKSGVPTMVELGAIDAELGEAFEVLQTDVETFLADEGPPVTQALQHLVRIDRRVRESLSAAPPPTANRLQDAKESPVVAGVPRVLDRIRSLHPQQGQNPRIETLDELMTELKQLTAQAPVFVSTPAMEVALHLCRIAGLSGLELAGWTAPSGSPLPLASCLPTDPWSFR
ncbi:MAG: hypothetical protein JNK85_19695 [Verrucomicrobiales bacterium]|nr:hypothetical protein [Verrucomicrobiales bacterium]